MPEIARQASRLAVQLRGALKAAEEMQVAAETGNRISLEFNRQYLADCMHRAGLILNSPLAETGKEDDYPHVANPPHCCRKHAEEENETAQQ
jgi:hypothetical protein